jgi:hypothetical protein
VNGTQAKVQFEATEPGLDFHEGHSTGGYAHICAAPCNATMALGEHRLALSVADHSPVEPDQVVVVRGPSTVTGSYTDRSGLRIAGLLVLGGSVLVGGIMMVAGVTGGGYCPIGSPGYVGPPQGASTKEACTSSTDAGLLAAGAIVLGVGAIAGVVLALQHDKATVTVTPLDAGRLVTPAGREGASLAPPSNSAPGFGVVARW